MEARAVQVDRVQRGPRWVKSSYTGNDNCVEAAIIGAAMGIRDSKIPGSPVIPVSPAAWVTLIQGLRP
ncbi:DUF397 domain-containing protein [Embleya sp. NPDC056575]|uniref:DUF397 domain-containing protein n=1 Tax=unclassified Embleya TaxID=2699296 RepID=UPI0036998B40